MRRREFILLAGSAAVGSMSAARAQKSTMPIIGLLDSGSPSQFADRIAAFRVGLGEAGFVEGRNVAIEFQWAEGHYDRLPALAADLVRRQVAVIAATGAPNSAKAAQAATDKIPIVFATGGEPVELGLVSSLSRPTGNITGLTFFIGMLGPKRLGMLRELVPTATAVGVLVKPDNPASVANLNDIVAAGPSIGLGVLVLNASTEADIDAAFEKLVQQKGGGLMVNTDSFLSSRRNQIVSLAARHRIPVVYPQREYFSAGGLLSYGTDLSDGYRQVGIYCGRILAGAKPADLPVLLPTKFELLINLKAAKALGLMVPPSLLATANEISE
jgi:putative tryptophan/tyrosine transport system substrate-binding protein